MGNKLVDFQVSSPNGTKLERSFTPDFMPDMPADVPYACGLGQLTAAGFQQMVGLGKHLADTYAEQLPRVARRLHVHSIDVKRSLASTVGFLMGILVGPQVIELYGDGTKVQIFADLNASADILRTDTSYNLK